MYKLTKEAEKDIMSILQSSVSLFGKEQTEVYGESLSRCIELLSINPGMGKNIDDIKVGYSKFPHGSHVIYFRTELDYILVVRILHKHMDAERNIG